MEVWKMIFLFKGVICGFYVSFRGVAHFQGSSRFEGLLHIFEDDESEVAVRTRQKKTVKAKDCYSVGFPPKENESTHSVYLLMIQN